MPLGIILYPCHAANTRLCKQIASRKCTPHYAVIRRYAVCVVKYLNMFVGVLGRVLESSAWAMPLLPMPMLKGGSVDRNPFGVGGWDFRRLSLGRSDDLTLYFGSVSSTVMSVGPTRFLLCCFVWVLPSRWSWIFLVHSFLGFAWVWC